MALWGKWRSKALFTFLSYLITFLLGSHGKIHNKIDCRDPDLGGRLPLDLHQKTRGMLLVHGEGAGIGNFLSFFPAAYFFAALSGRDIAIMDKSTIADFCKIVYCGFPLESQMVAAYPHLRGDVDAMEGGKSPKFRSHFMSSDPKDHLNSMVTRADGYMHIDGWYLNLDPEISQCIANITRCEDHDDVHCHDRHALQRLVRGPFKSIRAEEESRILGVPTNLKHAVLALPHAFSPRLDAAVHIRCQFSHFEMSVGRDDGQMWLDFVKERDEWINSTETNGGQETFRVMADKILQELPMLRSKAIIQHRRRLAWLEREVARLDSSGSGSGGFGDHHTDSHNSTSSSSRLSARQRLLLEQWLSPSPSSTVSSTGDKKEESVYVYVASDNEVVKEAFAAYLLKRAETDTSGFPLAVMRVKNEAEIAHAKNGAFFRSVARGTGPFDLAMDWYVFILSLSLSLFSIYCSLLASLTRRDI
jgi:hypothetical protein